MLGNLSPGVQRLVIERLGKTTQGYCAVVQNSFISALFLSLI